MDSQENSPSAPPQIADKIPDKPGIYLLTNKINGKIYVGKSNCLRQRMRSYKSCIRPQYKSCCPVVFAIRKYGWNNFRVDILECFEEIENQILLEIETEWIERYDSTNKQIGYNIYKYSTDGTGRPCSEEKKKKISDSLKGRYTKEKSYMYGKKHSPEMILKMKETIKRRYPNGRIGSTGLKRSPEQIQKMMGRVHSKETREKISKAKKGKFTKENHPFYGKKHSEKALDIMRMKRAKQDCSFRHVKIKQINPLTRETMKEWPHMGLAAKKLGIHKTGISNVLRKKVRTAGGFCWGYVNE